jgi:hypothetical protein
MRMLPASGAACPWNLHNIAAPRQLERRLAAALPPHSLMQRAGLSVARLALALAPHARSIWVAWMLQACWAACTEIATFSIAIHVDSVRGNGQFFR